MPLSKIEKETTIYFNDGEKHAVICTCNSRWIRGMTQNWGKGEELDGGPYIAWIIPKNRLRVPKPKSVAKSEARKKRIKE